MPRYGRSSHSGGISPGGGGNVTTGGGGTLTLTRTFNQLSGTSTPTTALWTIGHPFAKAEVPTGNILTATLGGASVRVDAIARKLHADGSLAWAQLLVDYTGVSITAGSSANLALTSTPGTWSSASGFTDSGWTGLVDTVELSNFSYGGTAGAGFNSPAGTWTATFGGATSGPTQNFIEVYGDCALGRYVWVRSRFVGSDGTTVHATLDCMMEYWVPRLVGGGAGPVLSRGPFVRNINTFNQSNIGDYSYTVTWKRGGVAQRTFNGVRQPQSTQSPCCRPDGYWDRSDGQDANIWISEAYANTRKTHKIPPLADGILYSANGTATPLMPVSAIDGSGNITFTGNTTTLFGNSISPSGGVTAIDFTGTNIPTGVTAGTVYWAKNGAGLQFTIYPTQADAIAGTNKIIPTFVGAGSSVRLSIAPQSPGCFDQTMAGGGGSTPDIALMTEWATAYHIANTYDFKRLGRAQAYNSSSMSWFITDNNNSTIFENGLGNGTPIFSALDATGNAVSPATPTGMLSYTSNSNSDGTNGGSGTSFFNGWIYSSTTPEEHMPESVYAIWVMEGGAFLRDLLIQKAALLATQVSPADRNYSQITGGTTYYGSGVLSFAGTALRIGAWNLRAFIEAEFASPQGSTYETYWQRYLTSNMNQIKAHITYKDQATTTVSSSGGAIVSNGQNTYAKLGVPWRDSAVPLDTSGIYLGVDGNYTIEGFMQTYMTASSAWAALLREDVIPDLGFFADFTMQWLNQLFNSTFCPYFATSYVFGPNLTDASGGAAPGNGAQPGVYPVPFGSSSGQLITIPLVAGDEYFDYTLGNPGVVTREGGNTGHWFPSELDYFRPLNYAALHNSNSALPPPTGLLLYKDYYVRNPNTSTGAFNLSDPANGPTGPLISFTGSSNVIGGSGQFVVNHATHTCPAAGSGTINAGGVPGLAVGANDYAAYHTAAAALHAVRCKAKYGATAPATLAANACYDTASQWFIGQANYASTCLWAYQRAD